MTHRPKPQLCTYGRPLDDYIHRGKIVCRNKAVRGVYCERHHQEAMKRVRQAK